MSGAPSARPAAAGGEGDWCGLIEEYEPDLVRAVKAARRVVGRSCRPEEIEDLLQEAYCRLLQCGGGLVYGLARRHPGQVRSYLRRIARSVVIDQLRTEAAAKRGGGRRRLSVDTLPEQMEPADPRESPEARLLRRERRFRIEQRLRDLLPGAHLERNLRIVEMAVVEGRSSAEIARRLGGRLTPSSVNTVLYRLRRDARELWAGAG